MDFADFKPDTAGRVALIELDSGQVRPILPLAALCSSQGATWTDLILKEYQSPAEVEHRDVAPAQHHLLLHMDEPARMELKLDGAWRQFELHRGQFFLCPAQMPMCVRCRHSRRFLSVGLDAAAVRCAGVEWNPGGVGKSLSPQLPFEDPFLSALLKCLREEIRHGYPGGRIYGEALTAALVAHLLRRELGGGPLANGSLRGLSRPQLRLRQRICRRWPRSWRTRCSWTWEPVPPTARGYSRPCIRRTGRRWWSWRGPRNMF